VVPIPLKIASINPRRARRDIAVTEMQPCPRRPLPLGRHVFARKWIKSDPIACRWRDTRSDVAGRILDRRRCWAVRTAASLCRPTCRRRFAGNIVDDDWNSDRVVDGLEVLVEAFLRRPCCSRASRPERRPRRFARRDAQAQPPQWVLLEPAPAITGTRPRASSMQMSTARVVFLMRERRALSGRSDRHKAVRARGDLPIDMGAISRLVDFAVLERRWTSAVIDP